MRSKISVKEELGWKLTAVILVLGIFLVNLVISTIFDTSVFESLTLGLSKPDLLVISLNIACIILFSLVSGYVAKENYIRIYKTFIVTTLLSLTIIGSLSTLFGEGYLSLRTAASPLDTTVGVIIGYIIASMVISGYISIFCLPSIKVGSVAYRYRVLKNSQNKC